MVELYPFRVNGVSGGGWNGEALRCGGAKTEFMSEREPSLAMDAKLCDNDVVPEAEVWRDAGSELRRRRSPVTA